jgi:predicted HAD superfamily Cof-like phosphohydrolase
MSDFDIQSIQDDVTAFHRKFGQLVGYSPHVPSQQIVALRDELIREETKEVRSAIAQEDLAEVADGIVDAIYVLVGTAVSYGIDLAPVWAAVHAANMAKEGGAVREDGKILKPAGWKAPDVQRIIDVQITNKARSNDHAQSNPFEYLRSDQLRAVLNQAALRSGLPCVLLARNVDAEIPTIDMSIKPEMDAASALMQGYVVVLRSDVATTIPASNHDGRCNNDDCYPK